MFQNAPRIRWQVAALVALSLALPGLLPEPASRADAATSSAPAVAAPSGCGCSAKMSPSDCCGTPCCQAPSAPQPQQAVPASTRSDVRGDLVEVVATLPTCVPPAGAARAAAFSQDERLSNDSGTLQSLHVRLDV